MELLFVRHINRGQEADEKLVSEGATTWAEQTDAEERAAAAERQVYSLLCCLMSVFL